MTAMQRLLRKWAWRRAATAPPGITEPAVTVPKAPVDTGEYQLLHRYLRDRYADRVVLTFAEIEDLLGFALPEAARLQLDWWGGAGLVTVRSAHSDAWTLARRTAKANLSARSVLFERSDPLQSTR
jgi:hypothetical protein